TPRRDSPDTPPAKSEAIDASFFTSPRVSGEKSRRVFEPRVRGRAPGIPLAYWHRDHPLTPAKPGARE
ncbi:MAG TPA: hypothetical protein VM529_09285, partial [Gemmata sp.]|nr:hypothetical protein [Gemmata sp.]